MKQFIQLLDSIRGFDLVLFSVLLVAFEFVYVRIAHQPNAGFQLYAASWGMSVLTSLLIIKIVRYARERLHRPH
jgi:hypothetical protein